MNPPFLCKPATKTANQKNAPAHYKEKAGIERSIRTGCAFELSMKIQPLTVKF